MAIQTRMTSAEFLALPETMLPMELIDGEVIMSPAPELNHQNIVGKVYLLLNSLSKGGTVYVAPVDVYLDEANTVQPDVLWAAPESRCSAVAGKYLRGGPDLVVELFSPGTARRDKREKFRLYEKHGVREYWMVDTVEKFIEVWVREGDKFPRLDVYGPEEQFASPLLSAVDTKAIFPPPEPAE